MLGAMKMALQRQLGLRLDHDALDLEAIAAIDRVVLSPGPVDALMQGRFAAPPLLQEGDQVLDRLGASARHRQHRVRRRHQHQILDAERDGEAILRVNDAIACFERDDGAEHDIAGVVTLAHVEHRIPTADI